MIIENKSLKALNTFGIEASARYYAGVENSGEIKSVLAEWRGMNLPLLVLGGGSNVLFTKDFEGFILHMCNKGIQVTGEDEGHIFVRVEAGEVWDDFVQFCIDRGLGGVENLVAIPGSAGAAPVQNIGAYGAEVKDVIEEVTLRLLEDGREHVIHASECTFGYRTSLFKTSLKGKVVITSVLFRLKKHPVVNPGYGDVQRKLEEAGIDRPGIGDISSIIRGIRANKLPDPQTTGNAGSFFKNPVVDTFMYAKLLEENPALPFYPQADGLVKLAAGWLIEQCGLKGYRRGDAAVHSRQALVLINHGNASGRQIIALAAHVIETVWQRFGVRLEPEVNIL